MIAGSWLGMNSIADPVSLNGLLRSGALERQTFALTDGDLVADAWLAEGVDVGTIYQQLLTLLGVLVGAAGSYIATAASERSRWRRQQHVRWDNMRVAAYADFGRTVKGVGQVSIRIAAHRGLYPHLHPVASAEARQELVGAEADRAAAWESLLLLASQDVIQAARRWHRAVRRMERFALGDSDDVDSWKRILFESRRAKAGFYEAARRESGVAHGALIDPDDDDTDDLVDPSLAT